MPIVSAVAIATSSNKELAKAIEKAMSDAVIAARAEGIKDPDEIRSLMLKARADVISAQRNA